MENVRQLEKIVAKSYQLPVGCDLATFLMKRAVPLYNNDPEFREFLDRQTSFLPKSTLLALAKRCQVSEALYRWYHYRDGRTKPHVCPVCSQPVLDYFKTYCCHKCSTLAPNIGAKRGPKVDLAKKEREFALPAGYKVVSFGQHRSTFRHRCGNVFEMSNRALANGSGKCECLHSKIKAHTLESVRAKYKALGSDWVPTSYDPETEQVTYRNRRCHHVVVAARDYIARCTVCKPKFATRVVTHKEYVEQLKDSKPEFKVVGRYVDSKTVLQYKHLKCGQTFEVAPATVRRKQFQCPHCAPPTCGSYRVYESNGRQLKVRGKEDVALDWILKNTSIKLSDIEVDSGGKVPTIRYRDALRTQAYYPDFYVKPRNLLVEVKDTNTLGLCREFFYKTPEQLWDTNCAKARACLDRGFKFKMMLFDRNHTLVRLPKDWFNMSHRQIKKWFAGQDYSF